MIRLLILALALATGAFIGLCIVFTVLTPAMSP